MLALALLKMSVKSWYSSGIKERSGGVDWDVEEAQAEMSLRLSVNCCVPGSSQAQRKATVLTREMSTFGVAVRVLEYPELDYLPRCQSRSCQKTIAVPFPRKQ